MKIAGIIAEYDPFHNGHAYHIAKTRAQTGAEGIVTVLGGEFTQRGEGAWCSKYQRTKAALLSGADLVLEMPLPYALGSAERFAKGGVSVLDSLGCVDCLSFGSESGDIEKIKAFAALSESEEFSEEMKKALSEGISVPSAREIAAKKLAPSLSGIAGNPNDTLGAEYCKWLARLNSGIVPAAVKRYGCAHGEEAVLKSGIASATYLRSFSEPSDIFPYVPVNTHSLLEDEYRNGKLPFDNKLFERGALAILRGLSEANFEKIPDCAAEGLYHRVYSAVREAGSLDELYSLIKTKRYTMSRVKRIVASAILGIDESRVKDARLPYIRVLGMNETGAAILKEAKASGIDIPLSSSLADLEKTGDVAEYFARLEARAEDLWQLGLKNPGGCGKAYTEKIIKI